ncbi:MAG: HesA/MoeB/ThiF family protein [Bacilli bacterium]
MERYQRNLGSITPEQQDLIMNAKVLVIGLGGLGGHVIEGLARLGFQHIGICDYDVVETSNLNRQVLSQSKNIGQKKVMLAQERIACIDPKIRVFHYEGKYPHAKVLKDLGMYDLIFDCLDNNETRLILENDTTSIGKVLIHGAIAGNYGYFGISSAGNYLIKNQVEHNKGVETFLNNPYYSPALVSNFQLILALKYLFKQDYLKDGFYVLDMNDLSIDQVQFK